MSDTPETDALVRSINSDTDIIRHEHDFCEMTWLARRLECERDEARCEAEEQRKKYDKLFDEAYQIRIERDEARRYANNIDLCQGGVSPCSLAVKLMAELNEAIRQCNETNESSKYAVEYAERERDEWKEVAQIRAELITQLQVKLREQK